MAWHFYFSNALPRLLGPGLVFSLAGPVVDRRLVYLAGPCLLYVGLMSLLAHKEWRFIVYIVPMLNTSTAVLLTKWAVGRGKWWSRLGRLALLCTIASSLLLSALGTAASRHNYPGGEALMAIQTRPEFASRASSRALDGMSSREDRDQRFDAPRRPGRADGRLAIPADTRQLVVRQDGRGRGQVGVRPGPRRERRPPWLSPGLLHPGFQAHQTQKAGQGEMVAGRARAGRMRGRRLEQVELMFWGGGGEKGARASHSLPDSSSSAALVLLFRARSSDRRPRATMASWRWLAALAMLGHGARAYIPAVPTNDSSALAANQTDGSWTIQLQWQPQGIFADGVSQQLRADNSTALAVVRRPTSCATSVGADGLVQQGVLLHFSEANATSQPPAEVPWVAMIKRVLPRLA